ncbi:MAG TPA: ferrous iron transport protein A [Desulfurella acetivorans]|jgi:ferrous iron transport protein A|uniref:Ferrous iron transport protein A n=1 Tax=Desulfurella acetivorans TaxID=33002 RepID=A0A7C6A7P4_DESAE|nr:ferrous iron transport protein A [Desulfurella acetivorans]
MRLIDCEVFQEVRVVGFDAGCRSKERLLQLGIIPGAILKIKRLAPFSGPLIVSIEGSDVVLGRGIAKKIIVEKV